MGLRLPESNYCLIWSELTVLIQAISAILSKVELQAMQPPIINILILSSVIVVVLLICITEYYSKKVYVPLNLSFRQRRNLNRSLLLPISV